MRGTNRTPDMAELPWPLALPADHLGPARPKVNHVDLAALNQDETAVRKEEAGYDGAQLGEIRMLRRIEGRLTRWEQRGERLGRLGAVLPVPATPKRDQRAERDPNSKE